MFFLPGATIAVRFSSSIFSLCSIDVQQALFSMPFMSGSTWLSSVSRIWLWFAFTVPTTSLVFLFYWYYKRQGKKRAAERKHEAKFETEDA
jgi:hypothetical protein